VSKVTFSDPPRLVGARAIGDFATTMFRAVGCPEAAAREIADHLVEAELSGVPSHGVDRILQYVEEFRSGKRDPRAVARVFRGERGGWIVDGGNGNGIGPMRLALADGCRRAQDAGLSVTALINAGHTGRLGAFCEESAEAGVMTIVIGGGGRREWPQVAPHGGRAGLLPTNPYAIGVPGGDRGPVILDFATSAIAGGWIYAARHGEGTLPPGAVIDRDGNPTRDPEDYFNGGAILPAAGPKGYALALVAEVIGEAMLGPVDGELNWLVLSIDTGLYAAPTALRATAESLLAEVRAAPPAAGVARVEVPGERERDLFRASGGLDGGTVRVPARTWTMMSALAGEVGVAVP
jgi:uncharacterized oxidoreductase